MKSPQKNISPRPLRGKAVLLLLYCGLMLFFGFYHWLLLNFNGANMETIAGLLMFGASGLAAPAYYYYTGVLYMAVLPLMSAIALVTIESLAFRYIVKKKYQPLTRLITVGILATFTVVVFARGTAVVDFIANRLPQKTDFFAHHYLDPKNTNIIPPAHKKNLVMIYVESMEDSYSNPAYYGRNLLAHLQPIEKTSTQAFMHTTGNAVHTAAGHVASQCGLPTRAVFFINLKDDEGNTTMFQNAVCLSDILANHGYYNVFMQSPYYATAGIGFLYSKAHRFNESYALEHWQANGYGTTLSDKQGIWGLHDQVILEEGYQKLIALQKKRAQDGTPFYLNITTIGFHVPASSSCTHGTTPEPFDKIVECTAEALANFIARAEKDNLLADTEVFIMGDHLTIAIKGVDIEKWRATYPKRGVYNLFYRQTLQRDFITHYDIFPTMLEGLGFKVVGGRLGFGYSAHQSFTDYPTAQQWDDMMAQAFRASPAYLHLWQRPDSNYTQWRSQP